MQILSVPKQQTAIESVLKRCSEKQCSQKLPCKPAVKIHKNTCEGDHIQLGWRSTACLFTKECISSQIFSKGFKLIFRNIRFPDQFPVAASIKRWPNPLETTVRCSIQWSNITTSANKFKLSRNSTKNFSHFFRMPLSSAINVKNAF